MRRDREKLPPHLGKLLAHVEEHLCDPSLTVDSARRAVGIGDHSLTSVFRGYVGKTLGAYIQDARLEIADRMLRGTGLEIGRISLAVGYSYHRTFARAYKSWIGERPSDVERRAEPAFDYGTWRRAWGGRLGPEEARDFLRHYKRLYPDADEAEPPLAESPAREASRVEVDGASFERFRAEELWREIQPLPAEERQRSIRRYRFHSPALFDLLRRKSREEGRQNRQRGIELARLALDSLEGGEEVFGEKIHDLRALGWAWLGNAHRLALDLTAAEAAFDRAAAEQRSPGAGRDLRIQARILDLEASLRIFQRQYDRALELTRRAQDLLRAIGDHTGEARLLTQQAAIYCYTGKTASSISALEEAKTLLSEARDRELIFAVDTNLANDHAKLGEYEKASQYLAECRDLCQEREDPLGALTVRWVEAMILLGTGNHSAAEELLCSVRTGYAVMEDLRALGLVTLDLAIFYSEQGLAARSHELASDAVPILEALNLYPETLAAVELLGQAAGTGKVLASLLEKVRTALLRDPLASAHPEAGARVPLPGSH